MNVLNAINHAVQSMDVLTKNIHTTTDNISNANNENYNRRKATVKSNQLGGVELATMLHASNMSLLRTELVSNARTNFEQEKHKVFQEIGKKFGTNFDTTLLVDSMQEFTQSWQSFQASPDIVGMETNVINHAKKFVDELKNLSSSLQQIDVGIEKKIRENVNELNTSLRQNSSIK